MHKVSRYIGSILVTTTLIAPLALSAMVPQDRQERREEEKRERYYDKKHKDYHDWDDRERASFSLYLTNNHRPVVEFRTLKDSDQQRYWKWRHDHPDHR